MIDFYLPVWLERHQSDEYFRLLECHYTFREVADSWESQYANVANSGWLIRVCVDGHDYRGSGTSVTRVMCEDTGHSLITGSSGAV